VVFFENFPVFYGENLLFARFMKQLILNVKKGIMAKKDFKSDKGVFL